MKPENDTVGPVASQTCQSLLHDANTIALALELVDVIKQESIKRDLPFLVVAKGFELALKHAYDHCKIQWEK